MLTFSLMLSAQLEGNAGADKDIIEQMESFSIVSLKRLMLQSSRKKIAIVYTENYIQFYNTCWGINLLKDLVGAVLLVTLQEMY